MRKDSTPFILAISCLMMLLPGGNISAASPTLRLDSRLGHSGEAVWKMEKVSEVRQRAEEISREGFDDSSWMEAVVPGTVLGTLVRQGVYPEPYHGVNNRISSGLIPDISKVGRDFYTYWFRTVFEVPDSFRGKRIWLRLDGINYRAEVWVNSRLLSTINGMFMQEIVDVTDFVKPGEKSVLAVKVLPVDMPGTTMQKRWGAVGEWHNGGDGNIGLNTTMLMTVGWDFTFMDGIRDRNTGIWKGVSLYATGPLDLRHPFVRSELSHPLYDASAETVSVTVVNPSTSGKPVRCTLNGEIPEAGVRFSKDISLQRGACTEVVFSPEEFPQLRISNPKLWWPVNKGGQDMYTLKLSVSVGGSLSDSLSTRFGIREILSDRNTPDSSRVFYVNGRRMFIRGSNWIPEAMLRTSDKRTEAELRYTRQCGINMLRLWGGGIEESETFYRLCDEYGILVWQEFWMTGDTRHPQDRAAYLANVESAIRRLRIHPSVACYVASNESTEVDGMRELVSRLDGTRWYQMQSECDGVHDGSPYKQVNPMRHYENTASERGSRVDGFNPEYGSPCLPLAGQLREMMDEKDLWPINRDVWDYLDGGGFSQITTLYKELVDQYGESSSIDEFARKAQALGAINYKSIWEVWNYNKLDWGDRFASGVLFWYHNSPNRHVGSMMWDWSLEPMASLYAAANALEPLHVQFDYLKNTVSVVNDYLRPFEGFRVRACVYDIGSRLMDDTSVVVDIPEDGVAEDVMTLGFGKSGVHFIKLYLYDREGTLVSSNFYWRSSDPYLGKDTLTGPATSGFQALSSLAPSQLRCTCSSKVDNGRLIVTVSLKNISRRIAFMTQLQLLDAEGKAVRPSFYSDNFFALVPGESKVVRIDTAIEDAAEGTHLGLSGWNITSREWNVL